MQYQSRFFLGFIIMAVLLTACGNHAPKEAKFIPKEVSAVLVMDPKSLHDKLEKSGINMDTLINRLFQRNAVDTNDRAHFYEIKDGAGMNWDSQIFFFALQNTDQNQSNATVLNLIAGLSDATKFESFLKKQTFFLNKAVQKEKTYSYIIINSESMIAWNESNVIGSHYQSKIKPVYDTCLLYTSPSPRD